MWWGKIFLPSLGLYGKLMDFQLWLIKIKMIDRLELMSTGPSRQFSIITIITITIILAFFLQEMTSSPQCPMLKLLDNPIMYVSFPQAVTLIKKSWESLTVNPNVNLSTPISAGKTGYCPRHAAALFFQKMALHDIDMQFRTYFFCQGNFWHQFSKWLSLPLSGRKNMTKTK